MLITLLDLLSTLLIISTKCDSFKLLKYENQSTSRPSHLCAGKEMKEQEEQGGEEAWCIKPEGFICICHSIFKAIKSVMLYLNKIVFLTVSP